MSDRRRVLLLICALVVRCAAADFSVVGTSILDPDGRAFIPIGANVNGKDWVWTDETTQHLAAVRDGWRFNFLRVNCRLDPATPQEQWPTYTVNNDLQKIVATYTPHRIVVCFDLHDWTGYPDDAALTRMTQWWRATAATYKDNPYVWFNIMNEPGVGGPVSSRYLTVHQAAIRAIRADAGASNVIVVDGANWGQDAGTWNADPVPTANSGILTYGSRLERFDGRTWGNIVFSMHCYEEWSFGDARLIDYIDRVHAAGHALFIGEFGSNSSSDARSVAGQSLGRVALDRGVGIVAWHYQAGDGFRLTTTGTGSAIDSLTAPTNLRWEGRILWDATHVRGYGLGGGGPQSLVVSTTALTVTEGSTGAFTVRLGKPPTANLTVTVTRTAGDADIRVQDGASLVFTPINWSTPRTVTLAAVQDADQSDGVATITVAAGGVTSVAVIATEADDDRTRTGELRINFQPATAPAVAGYLIDSGQAFAARGNGQTYGWSADISATSRDRNAAGSADQRYDTLLQPQLRRSTAAVWELAVPNGAYLVHLVCGDAAYTDSTDVMTVEGVEIVHAAPTPTRRWCAGTVTVSVADGRLTLSAAAGAVNTKVCWIEVAPVPSGVG